MDRHPARRLGPIGINEAHLVHQLFGNTLPLLSRQLTFFGTQRQRTMPHVSLLRSSLHVGFLLRVPRLGCLVNFSAIDLAGLIHNCPNGHGIIVAQHRAGFHRKRHSIIASNNHRISVFIGSTGASKISHEASHTTTTNNVGHHATSPSKANDSKVLFTVATDWRTASRVRPKSLPTVPSALNARVSWLRLFPTAASCRCTANKCCNNALRSVNVSPRDDANAASFR